MERHDNGLIKKIHLDNPKVGYTLIISPYEPDITYQTKPITKIIELTDSVVHFKTTEDEYKLQIFEDGE